MTANDEDLASRLAMLNGAFDDAELDQRVSRFQDRLRQLQDDPAETARIDALVMDAERAEPGLELAGNGEDDEDERGHAEELPAGARLHVPSPNEELHETLTRHYPATIPQARAVQQYPGADPAAAPAANEVKIGMWGAPGSGKTTYLAALRLAVDTPENGRWTIYPRSADTAERMTQFTHALVTEHHFPEATLPDAMMPMRWHVVGDLAGSQFDHRKLRRRAPLPSEFTLDLVDVSGEAFGYQAAAVGLPQQVADEALDLLASAQGLLYFFDPITERRAGHSAEYLNRVIVALSQRMLAEGRLVGRYLPHYVSVCITKFDDPQLFQQVKQTGLMTYGPGGRPQVSGENAKTLFDMICEGSFWEDKDERSPMSARFVRDQLENLFHPDRIRFFMTSSIGLRQLPHHDPAAGSQATATFDPGNYANIHMTANEQRIIGPIAPINVLEPLLSLHHKIAGTTRVRPLRIIRSERAEEGWPRGA